MRTLGTKDNHGHARLCSFFLLRPIEWAKTQYAEAFCLFGLMVFIGVLWGTMFLAFGLPMVFWIFAGIGFVGLILFLVTLVLFAMKEK